MILDTFFLETFRIHFRGKYIFRQRVTFVVVLESRKKKFCFQTDFLSVSGQCQSFFSTFYCLISTEGNKVIKQDLLKNKSQDLKQCVFIQEKLHQEKLGCLVHQQGHSRKADPKGLQKRGDKQWYIFFRNNHDAYHRLLTVCKNHSKGLIQSFPFKFKYLKKICDIFVAKIQKFS